MLFFFIQVLAEVFKDCFSHNSYISGNQPNLEVTLVLEPQPYLEFLKENNKCQDALNGLTVTLAIKIGSAIFDRKSTQPGGDLSPVTATYHFNQKLEVSFQIRQFEYNQIIKERTAIYSADFANSFVVITGPINQITHTKVNGTRCFTDIYLEYELDNLINVRTEAINYPVDFTQSIVTLQYFKTDKWEKITMEQCTIDCDGEQYTDRGDQFEWIKQYKQSVSSVSPTTKQQMLDFFSYFRLNRAVQLRLVIDTIINGITRQIIGQIHNKKALDMSECLNKTEPKLHLNANDVRLLIMQDNGQVNELICQNEIEKSTKIEQFLVIFTRDYKYTYNTSLTVEAATYYERVGARFAADQKYTEFLELLDNNNIQENNILFQVFIMFLDEQSNQIYEFSLFTQASYGCFEKALLLYDNEKMCVKIHPKQTEICKKKAVDSELLLSIYSQNGDNVDSIQWLGDFYNNQKVNYSSYYVEFCVTCDLYDDSITYNIPTVTNCTDSLEQIKKHIKGKDIWFYINNGVEFMDFPKSVINNQFGEIWYIFAGIVVSVLIIVIITAPIIVHKHLVQFSNKSE